MLVLPIVNDLMGQSYVAIVQKTANPQVLALREFTANPDRPVSDSEPIQTAGSLIGECIERREAIYAADLSTLIDRYSDVANFYRQGLAFRRHAAVARRRTRAGHVQRGRTSKLMLTRQNRSIMEQIASQLAITIENLNLAEQTQQTLAELDAANRQLDRAGLGTIYTNDKTGSG